MQKVIIKKNRYVDSVSLMSVSDRVIRAQGVMNVEVQMATPLNVQMMTGLGYELPEGVGANDLVIAVTADSEEKTAAAVRMAEDIVEHRCAGDSARYASLEEVNPEADGYGLAQISLPGEYAAAEARTAIEKGMDVFVFSDNVPLEEELALKKLGRERGRLVMGPDCGVGLIDGIALAAGSIVAEGPVGIVGASGSGAQEVACIVEKCGLGVSAIIGTGGRDLYPEIGGITMLEGIKRLEADAKTEVIVLVSKLADLQVMDRVLDAADKVSKPVTAVFLGSDESLYAKHRVRGVFSLEAAALKAVELVTGEKPVFGYSEAQIKALAKELAGRLGPEQKYFRGLYCGGTFAEEALLCFDRHNRGCALRSNLDTRYSCRLEDFHVSAGHTILDMGAEDFTAEAPHPIFDPSLRLKRLQQELRDPEVGVVLLDFITGPGVHSDPISAFAGECGRELQRRKGALVFIVSICGSREDPQDNAAMEKLLNDAGAVVMRSNYQSALLASAMMNEMEQR